MNGFDSLMNESNFTFKRGQKIKFTNSRGDVQTGSYVMASSASGYIVLNVGGAHGRAQVVHTNSIIA